MACFGNTALRTAPVPYSKNTRLVMTIVSLSNMRAWQVKETPLDGGFSFYLQPHHLEILASLHCTVAKTFLKPPAFFCYKLYVHKLYVSNCVSDKHSICNSVMIPGLGLGRIDLALTQSNPIYTCSTQLFHPAQHPSLHLICLWETSFSHSRLWNRTVKVPEAMG